MNEWDIYVVNENQPRLRKIVKEAVVLPASKIEFFVTIVTLQTFHVYSTLKRRGNEHFHVVSTWNTRGVFVG